MRLTASLMMVFSLLSAVAEAAGTAPVEGRLEVGREYDSNVFSLPDEATISNLNDWRTTLQGRLERTFSVNEPYRLTPRYDLYGYWYNDESRYNLLVQRLTLRLDNERANLRPRLEYVFTYGWFGTDPYQASHRFSGRLTVHRAGDRRVWMGGHVAINEAPGGQYDYLSGEEYQVALSAFDTLGKDGWVYGSLELRYLDRGTNNTTFNGVPVAVKYSYMAFEPLLSAFHPLAWRLDLTGSIRYEYRRYSSEDVWGGATPGSKRRQDNKFTGSLSLSRPVWGTLSAELTHKRQIRTSNIGNARVDYRDRDYTRYLTGFFLKKEF